MKFYAPTSLSENIHETPEGFLVCVGVPITRTGELIYGEGETPLEVGEDGTVVIYRDESIVFNPITMASFEGKAVTIRHPQDFVGPNNWGNLAKGTMQNIRRGDGDQKNCLLADLLITDSIAIGLVKNGLREVSLGYEAEYIQTGKGKGRQEKIVGNHCALVEEGRAGETCAINDHKGKDKSTMAGLKELLAKLSKVADEEMKEDKKEEKKDESKDASAYDELVKVCNALSEKMDQFMGSKGKDEKEMPAKEEPKKADDEMEKKDEPAKDEEVASSLEERMKQLEAAVAKLLEGKSEEMGDEDADGAQEAEEESEDNDFEESSMVGDTASRAEILSPGIQVTKDIKAKALKAAYATKEGKKIIDDLTGGKPTFDSAEKVSTLFIAASEVLKATRGKELSKTKQVTDHGNGDTKSVAMTAEKMNEINAAHWANRK